MTIHLPQYKWNVPETERVVCENLYPNQRTIQPINKRVLSLLMCAYEKNAYIKAGYDKFIVLEARTTIVGQDREVPFFKFGDPIEKDDNTHLI